MVRMQWGMPIGPVRQLVRWLESAGCLVVEESFGTTRVDGMSQWIDTHPVIYIDADMPTDRKRLTVAHELGHLVLHSINIGDDVEAEANAFAAEFLMPLEVIRPQVRNLLAPQLPDLKRQWGVSMAALIERSNRAGLMNAESRTRMYKLFSTRGWRTSEPFSDELPPERPNLVGIIPAALVERGLSAEEIGRIAGFASARDNQLFEAAPRGLRAL